MASVQGQNQGYVRTVGQMAPMRSMLLSIPEDVHLPWHDVIIDCQGPFMTSKRGNRYVVSYHCTLLGYPKLQVIGRLGKEEFLRAMMDCLWETKVVPRIVRTDRGPEMVNAVMEEFYAVCNTKQFLGAAFTPRHQGPGERKHQVVMQQWLILIHQICKAFPQEWDVLAPVVEYLLEHFN